MFIPMLDAANPPQPASWHPQYGPLPSHRRCQRMGVLPSGDRSREGGTVITLDRTVPDAKTKSSGAAAEAALGPGVEMPAFARR